MGGVSSFQIVGWKYSEQNHPSRSRKKVILIKINPVLLYSPITNTFFMLKIKFRQISYRKPLCWSQNNCFQPFLSSSGAAGLCNRIVEGRWCCAVRCFCSHSTHHHTPDPGKSVWPGYLQSLSPAPLFPSSCFHPSSESSCIWHQFEQRTGHLWNRKLKH